MNAGQPSRGGRACPDLIVRIGEVRSARGVGRLLTFALGSCLGVVAYDPLARVGGLLHAMLPDSLSLPDRARDNPHLFVDTGISELLRSCIALGAKRERLWFKAAGGANPQGATGAPDFFRVGERNGEALKRAVRLGRLNLVAADLGGHASRTVQFDVASGRFTMKTSSGEHEL